MESEATDNTVFDQLMKMLNEAKKEEGGPTEGGEKQDIDEDEDAPMPILEPQIIHGEAPFQDMMNVLADEAEKLIDKIMTDASDSANPPPNHPPSPSHPPLLAIQQTPTTEYSTPPKGVIKNDNKRGYWRNMVVDSRRKAGHFNKLPPFHTPVMPRQYQLNGGRTPFPRQRQLSIDESLDKPLCPLRPIDNDWRDLVEISKRDLEPFWLKKLKKESGSDTIVGLLKYFGEKNQIGMIRKLVEREKAREEEEGKKLTEMDLIMLKRCSEIPAYRESLSKDDPTFKQRLEEILAKKKEEKNYKLDVGEIPCHLCNGVMKLTTRKSYYQMEIREYPAYRCTRKGCQTFRGFQSLQKSYGKLKIAPKRATQKGNEPVIGKLMKMSGMVSGKGLAKENDNGDIREEEGDSDKKNPTPSNTDDKLSKMDKMVSEGMGVLEELAKICENDVNMNMVGKEKDGGSDKIN